MDLQSSTESLLLGSLSSNLREDTPESVSTAALINDKYYSNSTGSLLNGNVQELLDRLHIPDTSFAESESNDSTVLSPVINDYESNDESFAEGQLRAVPQELHEITDPILSILYNKIQVFLLRNRLSLEFLKIFKRYVGYLSENGQNPLEDRYFLTLQNELSESYDFTPNMEELLNVFLVRPENMIVKMAFFEHKRLNHLLLRVLRTWRWRLQMRTSLSKLEHVWQEYLARKYLLFWSKKLQIVTTDVVAQANDFYRFTLVSSTFDKWLTRIESDKAKKGLADHYFVDHFLQRIVRRMSKLQKEQHNSEGRYNERCQRNALRLWRLRFRERTYTIRQRNLLRTVFNKVRLRLISYQELQERADFTRSIFQVNPSFQNWRLQYFKREEQSASLRALENKFLRKRTFGMLKRVLRQKEQENLVRGRLDTILLRFFVKNIWGTRFYERVHLYSLSKISDERLALKYTQLWKIRLFGRMKAENFWRFRLMAHSLHEWKLQTHCQERMLSRNRKTTKIVFLRWREYSESKRVLQQLQHNTFVRRHYRKWRERFEIVRETKQKAVTYYELTLEKLIFNKWLDCQTKMCEMEERSLIFKKLHALSILKLGIAHMRDVHRLSEVCNTRIVSKASLARFFVAWKKLAYERHINRVELIGSKLEEELRLQSQQLHLHLWLGKLHLYRSQCLAKADETYGRNLQRNFLITANKKVDHIEALYGFAEDLRSKTLSLNFFFIWRDRLEYVETMNTKVETETNKKNLALLLNYLNVWSMRMLKSRRNDETVQIFRMRWDRAAVRGLMLLWKNRSDNSPKKVRASRLQKKVSEGMELVTPVRRNVPRKNTIPGSEGVKRYRLEAMKSHYGRVRRAIPSPVKSSATLNSTAKRKIESEQESTSLSPKPLFPPRLSLERINKNLASKIDTINFERIPEVRLDPFVNTDPQSDPRIDTSLLEDEDGTDYDESPIRRM